MGIFSNLYIPDNDNEDEEEQESLKKDDHYHFSIPFTYIKKRYNDYNCEEDTAYMEVDIDWDERQQGYTASYYIPSRYNIDPNEGNGDEESIWNDIVYSEVSERLYDLGIGADACAFL